MSKGCFSSLAQPEPEAPGQVARTTVPRKARAAAHSRCGCCSAGVDESIKHAFLDDCEAHDETRAEFLPVGRVEKVYPPFWGNVDGREDPPAVGR